MKKLILFLSLFLCLMTCLSGESIAIYTFKVDGVPQWDLESIKTGIAGSEEAVIYMSIELAKLGHQVIVIGDPPKDSIHSRVEANPRYVDQEFKEDKLFDVAIAWRSAYSAKNLLTKARKVYLWPHDTFSYFIDVTDILAFNDVLWLSEWQRKQWEEANNAFGKFTHIFGNGIVPEQFMPVKKRKNPHALIYGSNYARGLEHLLNNWPVIKEAFPKATLDIYYGWNHWGLLSEEKERTMRIQVAALRTLGVTDHEKVGHLELNRAFEKASIWAYPCIAAETFCITALKAQMSGAIPVILEGTALPETVKHGYKVTTIDAYIPMLLKAMKEAESISLDERKKMREFILRDYTWKAIAKKWHNLFKNG